MKADALAPYRWGKNVGTSAAVQARAQPAAQEASAAAAVGAEPEKAVYPTKEGGINTFALVPPLDEPVSTTPLNAGTAGSMHALMGAIYAGARTEFWLKAFLRVPIGRSRPPTRRHPNL
eukprot:GEMP01070872.1.p3 GENE.GEMP01070872.1~~GEMP01070872.1.p3  ORF type:complete len:119 (+),score=22.15 GEMP01070872.1:345-701(+)